jgi:DNA-directed RNA polymerase subunit M/transcription elongation factor TFIIS
MVENTYLYKAFKVLELKKEPQEKNLFDDLTLADKTIKPGRFLIPPEKIKEEKENLDCLYTDRTTTCPRCKNNEFYRVTKQTRGGDEGETIFLECKYCKKRLKI